MFRPLNRLPEAILSVAGVAGAMTLIVGCLGQSASGGQRHHVHLIPAARIASQAAAPAPYLWHKSGSQWHSTVKPSWFSHTDRVLLLKILLKKQRPRWYVVAPSPKPVPTPTPVACSVELPTTPSTVPVTCNPTPRPTSRPAPTLPPPATPVPSSCLGSPPQCELLSLINNTRAYYGRQPLMLVGDMTTIRHVADEVSCACIFHQDARFPNESFPYGGWWAENTGYASSLAEIHNSMMAEGTSTCAQGTLSHACNIIAPGWTQVALGVSTGAQPWGTAVYAVEDFR